MARVLTWTAIEDGLIRQLYPDGGADACLAVMPNRKRGHVRYRAHKLGVISKEGEQMKRRMERKPEVPYSPSNELERRKEAEIAALCGQLREWGTVSWDGAFLPMVQNVGLRVAI